MTTKFDELENFVKAKLEKLGYKVSSKVRVYKDFEADLLAKKDGKTCLIELKSTENGIISTLSTAKTLIILPGVDFVYIAAPLKFLEQHILRIASYVGLGVIGVTEHDLKWDLVKPRELGPASISGGGGYPSFVVSGQIFEFHPDITNRGQKIVTSVEVMYLPGGPFEVPPGENNRRVIDEIMPDEHRRVDFKVKVRPNTKPGKYYLFAKRTAEGVEPDVSHFEIEVRQRDEETIKQAVSDTVAKLNYAVTTSIEKVLSQIDEAVLSGIIDAEKNVLDKSIWNDLGVYCLKNGLHRQAELVYTKMLETLKKYEKQEKKRIHKGLALQNLGIALFSQGKIQDAKKRITEAYEEDRLTYGDEAAEGYPAKKALTQLFPSET